MKLISQEQINKLDYLLWESTANIPLKQVVPILDMLQTLENSNEDELKEMLEVKDKKIAELEKEINWDPVKTLRRKLEEHEKVEQARKTEEEQKKESQEEMVEALEEAAKSIGRTKVETQESVKEEYTKEELIEYLKEKYSGIKIEVDDVGMITVYNENNAEAAYFSDHNWKYIINHFMRSHLDSEF